MATQNRGAAPSNTLDTATKGYVDTAINTALAPTYFSAVKANTNTFTSNTTTAADPELTLSVVANATYEVSGRLYYTADPGGDLKFGFEYPAGTGTNRIDGYWAGVLSSSTGTTLATATYIRTPIHLSGGQSSASANFGVVGGVATSVESVVEFAFTLIVGASAGSLTLVLAQSTSSSSATVLLAQSRLSMARVA